MNDARDHRPRVEDVVVTDELDRRPSRAPDHEAESRALRGLAEALASEPDRVFQLLAEAATALTRSGSAGVSLLEPGGAHGVLRCVAAAGAFAPHPTAAVPREASPCGEAMARDRVLLVRGAERVVPALLRVRPRMHEALLAPFRVGGEPAGTVWAIEHGPQGRFEREDARLLDGLARFAAAARGMTRALDEARGAGHRGETLRRVASEGGRTAGWRWDLRSRTLLCDPAFAALWGVPPAEGPIPFGVFQGRMTQAGVAATDAVMAGALAPGEGFDEEIEVASGPAAPRWVRWRGRAGAQTPWIVAGVGFDTTERRRERERLREGEARGALLLRVSDAIRTAGDPAEIQHTAMRLLGEHLGLARAYCFDVERDDRGWVHVVHGAYQREPGQPGMVGRHSLEPFGGWMFDGLARGEVVAVSDVSRVAALAARERALYRALGVTAFANVPFLRRGGYGAGIAVHDTAARAWTPGEIALIREVGERTWTAVERARAEAALRESETRFRTLADTAPAMIWHNGAGGENLFVNRYFLDYTGKSADEIEGLQWHTLVHPDHAASYIASYRAAVRDRVAWHSRNRILRHDGEWRWFDNHARPIFDRDGAYLGHVGVSTDVDASVRAETALREGEERLRQFGEASQDVLWIRDAETLQWQYLTPAFEPIYGLSREEALSGDNYRNWLELIVPEDRARASDSIARVRAGERVTFEYRIRRPGDGAIRWLRNTDFPIAGEAGRVTLFGGIGHDATELRAAEHRLRVLMEGIPQLVWRAVDGGEWTWSSPQWSAYTGQTEAESLGRGWLDAVHPDDRGEAVRVWDGAEARGFLGVEYRVRDAAHGRHRWFQNRATAVRDEGGRIVEWLGTSTDVDELRRLQGEQAVMVAELQHRTRNLITVVRSIAGETLRSSGTLGDFRHRFDDRLAALSRVQGLLSRPDQEPVTLGALLRMEFDALGAEAVGDRLALDGPEVGLRKSTVQTLALALHELATNARKYGALAARDGRLRVTWRVGDADGRGRRLRLEWVEEGAPHPGDRGTSPAGGYGRRLIEEALPYALDARTSYALDGAGVRCTIDLPLAPPHREGAPPEEEGGHA